MHRYALVLLVTWVSTELQAQGPDLPAPVKEHDWLKQFVGEWELEGEVNLGAGQPPMKAKGFENNRMVGGFWMVSQGKSEMMGVSIETVMTVGYDPEKKKFVGNWVDSSSSYHWKYEGALDSTGKVLTLESEGPSPLDPKKMCKFREIHEFKSPDHRAFTGQMRDDNGKWTTFITANSRRRK